MLAAEASGIVTAGEPGESTHSIPLGLLKPSPTNPRKRFNQVKIDELAASIKKLGGVFQPILARPNPEWAEGNGMPLYEIVAGERRWRASKQAEMPTVLALVRELSDFQALEIQLIENIEREDLHPLEEADGMRKLLRDGTNTEGYANAEELAERLGKSRRWVFLRLALLNLCDSAREAFMDDRLNASVAGLIARMPDQAQQAEATKRILEGFGGEPFTFRSAAAYLHKEFMLDLTQAPFDTRATFQVAGPCGTCMKRSGATPDLFEDVKSGDLCQDSVCFKAKANETHERKITEAQAAGHTVLRGAAAAKLMPGSSTALPSGFLWFDQAAPTLTADKRPLSELFGAKQRGVYTLEHSSSAIVRIVPETDARKLLKSKGLLRPPTQAPSARITDAAAANSTPSAPASKGSTAPVPPTPKPQPRSAAILGQMTEARGNQLLGKAVFALLRGQLQQQDLPLIALRLLIVERVDEMSHEATALMYEGMGWPNPATGDRTYISYLGDISKRLQELSGRELGELLVATLVLEELTDHDSCEDLETSDHLGRPTWSLLEELQLSSKLPDLRAKADEDAFQQINQEEEERLGAYAAGDAFAAAFAAAPKPGSAQYRNAATGETWSGRGLQPKWLKAAIAAGARLDDFAQRRAAK